MVLKNPTMIQNDRKMVPRYPKWVPKYPKNGHKVIPNMVLDGSWMEYDGDRWSGCELDGVRWGWVELDGCKREVDSLSPAQLVLTELNTFGESKTSFLKMKLEPLAFFFFSTLFLSNAF